MAILAAPVREVTGAKPASRKINYCLLIVVILSLVVAKWVHLAYHRLGLDHDYEHFGSEECVLHAQYVIGAEDITMVFAGVYLTSSDDRTSLMLMKSKGPTRTEDGAIYAIWDVKNANKVGLSHCFYNNAISNTQ
ncbi:unnamed protein product [Choristocarpus tenellus]